MNRKAKEYCQSIHELIRNFCYPLEKYLGIKEVHYCKAFKTGKYILISNSAQLNQSFLSKISYSNIFFQDYLNYDSSYELILWPNQPKNESMQVYLDHGYWHGITLVTDKNDESIEMISFLSDLNNPQIIYFYCKYFQVLERFASHFKQFFSKDFNFSTNDQRLATLTEGVDMYVPGRELIRDKKIISEFYKAMGIHDDNHSDFKLLKDFTPKEIECIKFLTKGFSAKYIAKELGISTKTAETHIYNLKKKITHNNKDNLIKNFKDFF